MPRDVNHVGPVTSEPGSSATAPITSKTRRTSVQAVDQTIPIPCTTDEDQLGSQPVRLGYDLGRLLGRGGEGEVHEARQLAFARLVAIKTLRHGHGDQRKLRRFRAEAAITALLEHPNIIPIHDLCSDPAGHLQLVMKKVSGKTWREIMNEDATTIDEHVAILLKVCDAMGFAHGRGILHRDLKPENVMVGEHGEVLVMDWGCAIHLGPVSPHPDVPVLHNLVSISGTPAYMSPEQARGDHAACGTWSDVYQLGAVLYRILTGGPPRNGNDVQLIIAATIRGAPIADPTASSGKRIPAELSAIAMAALQADVAKRTATISIFAEALRKYFEHREVLDLVADARREHQLALAHGPEAEDAFRRSLCAAEQAVRLWPELQVAQRLLVTIGVDAAQQAVESAAYRTARRLAQAAAGTAIKLGDETAVKQAQRLAAVATSKERAGLQRERRVRQLRSATITAGSIAGLILAVGMLLLWRESARTNAALATAKANLEQAERERLARVAGEELAAPALLAQAREKAHERKFAEGLPLVDAAIGFKPKDPEPLLHRAQLLIALGRRTDAVQALDAALALRQDADVRELRRLCATPPADAEVRMAELLVRMGASAAAGTLSLASDQRIAMAVGQLRRHWPGMPATCISTAQDGTMIVRLSGNEFKIDSLEPLRGMPITALDINHQDRVRDLKPLTSLPLSFLSARLTGVRDFTPLRGLPLRRLYLGWYETGFDLELVRGMKLESLDAPVKGIQSLAVLSGMPLKEVRLYSCDRLSDLGALRGMPLEILVLDAPKPGANALSDLSPLSGAPLIEISLSWQRNVSDLSPLRGMPLRRVVLNGNAVSDLAPIIGPSLRQLAIGETQVTDLRPLLTTALETLDFAPNAVTHGLDECLAMRSLRLVNSNKVDEYIRWVALCRIIVETTPNFGYMGRWVSKDGKFVELRLDQPLRSLTPLATLEGIKTLHLAGEVTDLRPLLKLPLVELVCNPKANAPGLAELRQMSSLQRIGSTPDSIKPAAAWWQERR